MTKKYICPMRSTCPYTYNACTNPTKFCRVIEDTPEHFSTGTPHEKYVKSWAIIMCRKGG